MHADAKRILVLIAAAALAALPFVHASHDGEHCYSTSTPEVDAGVAPAPRYYVDQDALWWTITVWVYEESNGIDGLQRDDGVQTDFGACEPDKDRWIDYDGRVVRGDTIIL